MGITTTFVVVVMLLLFSASCSKEHKEVVDVEFDPDKTYTMKATDVANGMTVLPFRSWLSMNVLIMRGARSHQMG